MKKFLISLLIIIMCTPLAFAAEKASGGDASFTRIAGKSRYETSIAISDAILKEKGINQFDAVIIASGENYPDALSGSSLAAVTDAPVILTNRANDTAVSTYISKNLKPGGKLYILGGYGVVSSSYEQLFSNVYEVKRFAGANRLETNLQILNEVRTLSDNEDVIICTAYGFADSLSASATGKMVLLIDSSLKEEQKAFLESLDEHKTYVIGGPSIFSKDAVDEIAAATGTSVKRMYGKTRYETSSLIAREFFGSSENLVIAYGGNYPDGLSGGSLALSRNCPLLLSTEENTVESKAYANKASVTSLQVLGGRALISDNTAYDIINGYVPESNSTITTDFLNSLDLDGTDNLMIVAHPDDETFWGGCHLAEGNYLIVCLTNGENITRNEEIRKATSISGDQIIILNYPDYESGHKVSWNTYKEDISSDLNTVITYKDWNTITTHNPDGEYGHVHHRKTSELVADACNSTDCYDKLSYFEVYFKADEMPAAYKPNMSPESIQTLEKMLACYKSQKVEVHSQMKGYEAFIKASRWGHREQLTAKAYQKSSN